MEKIKKWFIFIIFCITVYVVTPYMLFQRNLDNIYLCLYRDKGVSIQVLKIHVICLPKSK